MHLILDNKKELPIYPQSILCVSGVRGGAVG